MKWGSRVVLVLLIATAAGMLGMAANLVRTRQGLNRARETESRARALSADADAQSVSLTQELRALKIRESMLEDQATQELTGPSVGIDSITRAAREMGLPVSRLDLGPTGDVVAVALTGPPANVNRWLQIVDRTMVDAGTALELLELSPKGEDGLNAEIRLRSTSGDGPRTGISATRALEAGAWPTASAQAFAAAFVRTSLSQPAELDAGVLRSPPPSNVVTDLRFLGIVSAGGVTHYAFRFGTAETVRTLIPGDQAFGWRLVSVSTDTLTLEKEGERFDIPK